MVRSCLGFLFLFCAFAGGAAPPVPPSRENLAGRRLAITSGTVFIPEHFRAGDATAVLMFVHGAAWVAEQEFVRAGKNAVLVTTALSSNDYAPAFTLPQTLRGLLDETTRALRREGITSAPLGRLAVASFSGGYRAVERILATTGTRELVSDVVLADSLYPRRIGPSEILDEQDLAPLLVFAREAAASTSGRTFQLSHLYPPEERHRGNTTTRAALWLQERLALTRSDDGLTTTSRGARIAYRAERGGNRILGIYGMTTQDHFEHFYGIGDLLARTGLPDLRPSE